MIDIARDLNVGTVMEGSVQRFGDDLKGRAHYRRWTRQDNETALAFYQQAIELDPEFSLAIAGTANSYALRASRYGMGEEWAEKAIQQAELALTIDPVLPEANKALGIVRFNEGHYQKSLGYYLKAVEMNPGYDEALDWYEQAVEAGRRRYEWDEQEPGFVSLRDEPRFHAALEKQRQQREAMHTRVAVMLKK